MSLAFQSSSEEADLLLSAFFLSLSFCLSISAWSILCSLFMLLMSTLTDSLFLETWLSLTLLFLISSIKFALFDEKLALFWLSSGGANSRGGGGGGGGRLFRTDCLYAYAYCFYYYSTYFIFCCRFLSWVWIACVFTCWKIVSSAMKFMI